MDKRVFDISLAKFVDPIEITRNNWIVGCYLNEPDSIHYEVHFCNSDYYKYGLLIDDVWAAGIYTVDALNKVDIYILYNCSVTNPFILDKQYCYFIKSKNIQKFFLIFDDLDCEYWSLFERYKNLHSTYSEKKTSIVLTIVTTIYNNAFLLEQTLQSVINQKSAEYEYIIKDACSKDNFEQVVDKYSQFGIKIVRSKDRGIYDGMDQGFKLAQGEFVQILNSDDVFHDSEVVLRYVEEIKKKRADVYCSDIELRYPDGMSILKQADISKLRYKSCINHTSLALKYSDYCKLGGFDKSLSYAADCDLTIKIVKAGLKIRKIPIVCVLFRMGGTSSTFSWKLLKESLICRYRYSILNIDGYFYTILSFLKNKIL